MNLSKIAKQIRAGTRKTKEPFVCSMKSFTFSQWNRRKVLEVLEEGGRVEVFVQCQTRQDIEDILVDAAKSQGYEIV